MKCLTVDQKRKKGFDLKEKNEKGDCGNVCMTRLDGYKIVDGH